MNLAVPPHLTVRSVHSIAAAVPMRIALGTSAATIREAPLLLIDLATEEGITGRAYLFCYRPSGSVAVTAVLHEAVRLIAGERVSPVEIAAKLERRYALIGVTGIVRMALSALDMALWDALAVAAGLPLATMLGGTPRPLPAYNSCGLGLMTPDAAADEAEQLLAGGFKAVKLRLGYATLAEDLAVTRAVRRRLADDIAVMVDYNQALTLAEALTRGRAMAHEGVYWIEEPIRHDDMGGYTKLARGLALPVQIGENFDGARAMARALDAGACDFVMRPMPGASAASPDGCRPPASRPRTGSKCRRICCRRRAPICWRRRRPPIGSNMSIGRMRSSPNPLRSRVAVPSHRQSPASASPGTRRPWRATARRDEFKPGPIRPHLIR
jgi:mandelate racemase